MIKHCWSVDPSWPLNHIQGTKNLSKRQNGTNETLATRGALRGRRGLSIWDVFRCSCQSRCVKVVAFLLGWFTSSPHGFFPSLVMKRADKLPATLSYKASKSKWLSPQQKVGFNQWSSRELKCSSLVSSWDTIILSVFSIRCVHFDKNWVGRVLPFFSLSKPVIFAAFPGCVIEWGAAYSASAWILARESNAERCC